MHVGIFLNFFKKILKFMQNNKRSHMGGIVSWIDHYWLFLNFIVF